MLLFSSAPSFSGIHRCRKTSACVNRRRTVSAVSHLTDEQVESGNSSTWIGSLWKRSTASCAAASRERRDERMAGARKIRCRFAERNFAPFDQPPSSSRMRSFLSSDRTAHTFALPPSGSKFWLAMDVSSRSPSELSEIRSLTHWKNRTKSSRRRGVALHREGSICSVDHVAMTSFGLSARVSRH